MKLHPHNPLNFSSVPGWALNSLQPSTAVRHPPARTPYSQTDIKPPKQPHTFTFIYSSLQFSFSVNSSEISSIVGFNWNASAGLSRHTLTCKTREAAPHLIHSALGQDENFLCKEAQRQTSFIYSQDLQKGNSAFREERSQSFSTENWFWNKQNLNNDFDALWRSMNYFLSPFCCVADSFSTHQLHFALWKCNPIPSK